MRNVLFDLDGTLVDSCAGIEWAARQAVQEHFPHRTLPPIRPLIGPPIREILARALMDLSVEEVDRLEASYRTYYDQEGYAQTALMPGAREALQRLKDRQVRCFVVTNKPTKPAFKVLRALELTHFFEAVVSPDSQMPGFNSKTQSTRWIVETYSLKAQETVLIGDARDDALAAWENSLNFFAASWGYGEVHLSDLPKSRILRNFDELV